MYIYMDLVLAFQLTAWKEILTFLSVVFESVDDIRTCDPQRLVLPGPAELQRVFLA
jgi:hypothetical protein